MDYEPKSPHAIYIPPAPDTDEQGRAVCVRCSTPCEQYEHRGNPDLWGCPRCPHEHTPTEKEPDNE